MPIYARHQVVHAWLVDPLANTLEILRLTQQQWLLLGTHHGDTRARAEPFEAIELELGALWAK